MRPLVFLGFLVFLALQVFWDSVFLDRLVSKRTSYFASRLSSSQRLNPGVVNALGHALACR